MSCAPVTGPSCPASRLSRDPGAGDIFEGYFKPGGAEKMESGLAAAAVDEGGTDEQGGAQPGVASSGELRDLKREVGKLSQEVGTIRRAQDEMVRLLKKIANE